MGKERKIRSILGAYEEIKSLDPNTELTPHAIRRMIWENKIPYYRTGKKYLIDVNELLSLWEGGNS